MVKVCGDEALFRGVTGNRRTTGETMIWLFRARSAAGASWI
jgi:hypothetical protein